MKVFGVVIGLLALTSSAWSDGAITIHGRACSSHFRGGKQVRHFPKDRTCRVQVAYKGLTPALLYVLERYGNDDRPSLIATITGARSREPIPVRFNRRRLARLRLIVPPDSSTPSPLPPSKELDVIRSCGEAAVELELLGVCGARSDCSSEGIIPAGCSPHHYPVLAQGADPSRLRHFFYNVLPTLSDCTAISIVGTCEARAITGVDCIEGRCAYVSE